MWNTSSTEVNEAGLIQAVAAGDQAAFNQLVTLHGSGVLALAQRVLGKTQDAEDIVQEVFTRAWLEASRWEPRASYRSWLYRVTLNLSLNHRQRVQGRFEPLGEYEEHLPCHTPNAEQQLLDAQQGQSLDRAIQQLPESQRLAIMLRYSSGLSVKETASVLEQTLKAT